MNTIYSASWRSMCGCNIHTHTRIYIHHTCIHTYIHTSCIHTYIHTCLLLLISMLWHRQAIFESKGDKLSSFAECRIRTHQGLRHQIASRLNARWQTDWAIEDQAQYLNSTARPYDQQAFSPLDPTAVWHSRNAIISQWFFDHRQTLVGRIGWF